MADRNIFFKMPDHNITKIIEKKRNGEKLTKEDITYFISAVVKSTLPDESAIGYFLDRSQIGAMLMAICFNGLDHVETTELTLGMKNSGYVFSWPKEWRHLVVDKHSTGGVGDKVSLLLAPALAAVGLKVPMISGRSLGHTGGTLDKLESIPGFRVHLTKEKIYKVIDDVGCCIIGQTEDCVPADKVLYECREITATVTCPPLIIASIVSKKLSEGTSALVYDVKYGKGSLFNSREESIDIARNLVNASKGTKASALITSMEYPLGKAIGNSLEVLEAIKCLQGDYSWDVIELTCALGAELLSSVKHTFGIDAHNMIFAAIEEGKALKKFHDMIIYQGVSPITANELCYGNAASVFLKPRHETLVYHDGKEGYIGEIDPLVLANIWKEEFIQYNRHPGVGLTLLKTVGDKIENGEPWITIHHQSSDITNEIQQLRSAISIKDDPNRKELIDCKISVCDQSNILKEEKC